MTSSPIFEPSPDTRLLRQRLRLMRVGDRVAYTELSAVIGKRVVGATASLQSATRSLLKHDAMVFSPIRGEGLLRLDDIQIVSAADADIRTMRRKARKGVRKLAAVGDYAAMPPASRIAHTTKISVLAAIADMTTDKALQKVEKAAVGRTSELPISETLRAFGG